MKGYECSLVKKAAQLLSNGEQLGLNVGYLTSDKEDNELYSPYFVVDHIIKYLPRDKIIWTPFDCEWSAFYQKLKEEGYRVVRSSLQDRQDFFEYEPDEWDIIVSNPPFSLKNKVLERLYSFNKPFAILYTDTHTTSFIFHIILRFALEIFFTGFSFNLFTAQTGTDCVSKNFVL